jgi:hypothetical protein
MEVFDRSLTHIPIEMHTKYISNFHIKYISNSDQFVSSGDRSLEAAGLGRSLPVWVQGKLAKSENLGVAKCGCKSLKHETENTNCIVNRKLHGLTCTKL